MWHPGRLRYCAPEVVADPSLPLEQQPSTVVTRAADIWAVGVIAFELLTQERVFPPEATVEDVVCALRGAGLPWERGAVRCARLRGLRGAVLACLARDPARRPSAAALLASWEHLFDSMKTNGTFATTRTATRLSGTRSSAHAEEVIHRHVSRRTLESESTASTSNVTDFALAS